MTTPSRLLRSAFGMFATGVTIVTTVDAAGVDVGMTANSFSSVSLDPPLLLWSVARSASNFAAFMHADGFVVHVLSEHQRALSDQFAKSSSSKFDGVEIGRGANLLPLLKECAAHFQCRTYARHDAGDHVILLGEITAFEHDDTARPLLYHGGRYSLLSEQS